MARIDIVAGQVADLREWRGQMELRMANVEAAVSSLPQIKEDNIRQTYLLERGAEDRAKMMTDIKAISDTMQKNMASVTSAMAPLKQFASDASRAKHLGFTAIVMFGGFLSWAVGLWEKVKAIASTPPH